ncbi:hypothetical protein QVD17_24851 [Tagetes erecta]|uniref:RPW8 domain-containing protein n=1 Tax=Tagetes erecta TaxID=13708 RepID=A0AAD8KFJ2_TARER|nr:hypothetical protein QVD17_24851 [Tagetes erecta]
MIVSNHSRPIFTFLSILGVRDRMVVAMIAKKKEWRIVFGNIEPVLYETVRLIRVLDRPENETKMFIFYLENGKELVLKCSRIKCWNVYKKFIHAQKLIRLDRELLRFFRVELHDNLSIRLKGLALGDDTRAGGFLSCSSISGLPDFVVGLDVHLKVLKRVLLKYDDEIKGIFGDNIIYVINKLRQMGSQKTLLVLDDVWSESESLIQDLKFLIPGYAILVTSRFMFSRIVLMYELSLLNDEDARTLFCHSAFPCDGNQINVPDDLVNNVMPQLSKTSS